MRAAIALFFAAVLSGCQHMPERVLVPVKETCRIDMPKKPGWATASLTKDSGIWDQSKALLAERRQRKAYESQLEAAITACNEPLPATAEALNR